MKVHSDPKREAPRDGDHLYFVLRWNDECLVSGDDYPEPNEFIHEIDGDVSVVTEDDEREIAGKFRLYYVDLDGALNEGTSYFDVFDTHSHTINYYGALFDPETGDFAECVEETMQDHIFGGNVLILDRLEILPKYRGRRFGLLVLREMMRRFSGGVAIVAMKPFPLQHEARSNHVDGWTNQMELSAFPKSSKESFRKLQKYYEQLGFKKLKGTEFMMRGGPTFHPLPKLSSLKAKR